MFEENIKETKKNHRKKGIMRNKPVKTQRIAPSCESFENRRLTEKKKN